MVRLLSASTRYVCWPFPNICRQSDPTVGCNSDPAGRRRRSLEFSSNSQEEKTKSRTHDPIARTIGFLKLIFFKPAILPEPVKSGKSDGRGSGCTFGSGYRS